METDHIKAVNGTTLTKKITYEEHFFVENKLIVFIFIINRL